MNEALGYVCDYCNKLVSNHQENYQRNVNYIFDFSDPIGFFDKSWYGQYLFKPSGDEWYMKLFDRTYCINSTKINNTMVQFVCLNWGMVQSKPTFTETRFIVNCISLFLSNA